MNTPTYTEVMLDLETMGNGPDAAIVAIGAVAFDIETATISPRGFYVRVDLESAIGSGGVMDPSTVIWWLQQSDEAREEITRLAGGVTEAEEALGRASAVTATARASLDSLDEEISAQSALVSAHDLEQGRLAGPLGLPIDHDDQAHRLSLAAGRERPGLGWRRARRPAARAPAASAHRAAPEADSSARAGCWPAA